MLQVPKQGRGWWDGLLLFCLFTAVCILYLFFFLSLFRPRLSQSTAAHMLAQKNKAREMQVCKNRASSPSLAVRSDTLFNPLGLSSNKGIIIRTWINKNKPRFLTPKKWRRFDLFGHDECAKQEIVKYLIDRPREYVVPRQSYPGPAFWGRCLGKIKDRVKNKGVKWVARKGALQFRQTHPTSSVVLLISDTYDRRRMR